jgi:hypothetical protein
MGGGFGAAAIGGGVRSSPMSANAFAPRAGNVVAGRSFGDRDHGFRGGDFHHGFRGRGFALGAFGGGLYDDYYDYPDYGYYSDYGAYPDYAYDDSYSDNGSCYVVQRRVHLKSGWRLQPVQVCN